MLGIGLYCRRTFLEDKYIGEVRTTIKELYDEATTSNGGSATWVYKVRNGLEISQGELKLSCSFGEKEIIEPTSEWKRILIGGGLILLHIAVAAAGGHLHGYEPFDNEDADKIIDYAC
ncbi:hypothetical protein RHMOL_Rhmol02G0013100 [Rhododendron molle]|uniref:Uncharacterized protein n=1 Tax=Rhododendron molle TaxID=49168 RepID=A0ACC0PMS3_RHOML|nr:hypothetical protein RHMOL_Rhmol02G0013100 [Rhododendron molle]